MAYRILSIDGGGIKGVHALQMLQLIQEEIDEGFLDKIDCFAGTSTGALICVALALGVTPKKLLFYYRFFGKRIFAKIKQKGSDGAKYQNTEFKQILHRILPGSSTFGDVSKDLVIPACRLCHPETKKWETEIYDSFLTKDMPLIDAALASSSAPIYFPSYQGCVDGGIYAINPSFVALGKAIDPKGAGKGISEVKLLSVGNGVNPYGIEDEANWGVDEWMREKETEMHFPLVAILNDLGAEGIDYPLKQLLKERYLRINTTLSSPVGIDDITKIPTLRNSAKAHPKNSPERWDMEKEWLRNYML